MQTATVEATLTGSVRAYPGNRMHFRLGSEQTNNELAVIDIIIYPGAEPPRHVHEREDECIMLLEGEGIFFVGDDIIKAKSGDIIFMPRNVPHHFKILSEKAVSRLVVTPGGFERFFEAITLPYNGTNPPLIERAPTPEEISRFVQISENFGIRFV